MLFPIYCDSPRCNTVSTMHHIGVIFLNVPKSSIPAVVAARDVPATGVALRSCRTLELNGRNPFPIFCWYLFRVAFRLPRRHGVQGLSLRQGNFGGPFKAFWA